MRWNEMKNIASYEDVCFDSPVLLKLYKLKTELWKNTYLPVTYPLHEKGQYCQIDKFKNTNLKVLAKD